MFFYGKLNILHRNAIKTLGHRAKRSRKLTDDEREERKLKHARALCLQGNLSKAYKTLVRKGLATEDKIQVLRDKHSSSSTILLQDQDILQDTRYLQDTIDWSELVLPRTICEVVQTKKAGRAADCNGIRIREHIKIILEKSDNFLLYCKLVLQPMIQGTFKLV